MEQATGWLQLVANYGLPIVLTIWFVFRINPTITKLTNLLEAFIQSQTAKELERREREKEIKDMLGSIADDVAENNSRIRILEVRSEK